MFALTHSELSQRYSEPLARCGAEWDQHHAVSCTSGSGPWDAIVGVLPDTPMYMTFFHRSGRKSLHHLQDPIDERRGGLFQAVLVAAEFALDHLTIRRAGFCAILRSNALIVLQDGGPNLYAPLGSGHEALEDMQRLEDEFPGIFAFETP